MSKIEFARDPERAAGKILMQEFLGGRNGAVRVLSDLGKKMNKEAPSVRIYRQQADNEGRATLWFAFEKASAKGVRVFSTGLREGVEFSHVNEDWVGVNPTEVLWLALNYPGSIPLEEQTEFFSTKRTLREQLEFGIKHATRISVDDRDQGRQIV